MPNDPRWQGKSVLITGVCGTVGRELLRQVSRLGPRRIVGLDNNETELFFLGEAYAGEPGVHLFLCDVRDRDGLVAKMAGIDIVLHTAALKHVLQCERSPRDALQTNVIGTQNVIDAAQACRVSRVLFTSSDKAVNPTNVMGTSKLMCERLVTAANAQRHAGDPVFASTRFGNVLGSRGSVVPLFAKQIAAGGPVTLTDPSMTRFIMTLEEAASLVMESVHVAQGGEVFVMKMPAVRIEDLARVLIRRLAPRHGRDPGAIELRTTGVKPGEKMYEELLSEEEVRRTVETRNFFVVLPAFKSLYEEIAYGYADETASRVDRAYNSSVVPLMDREELGSFLARMPIEEMD
jgi:FlaA1/EpsC-like NDP-sugar epimerase